MFRVVAAEKLAQGVAKQIVEAIEHGTFAPGQELPSEREMMQAFGVGRTSIREALLALQQQGFIDIRHGRRSRVASPQAITLTNLIAASVQRLTAQPERFVENLKETRLGLEVTMAARAAEVATDADIASLMVALAANQRAIASGQDYLRSDIAFHQTIARITGNAILVEATAVILQWLARFRTDMVHVKGANLLSHDEHVTIARAIEARDPAAAAEAMRRHQLRSNSLYGQLLAQQRQTTKVAAGHPAKPNKAKSRRKTQWHQSRLQRSAR
jgi:DNA-binding FadR family transcriptional regulator